MALALHLSANQTPRDIPTANARFSVAAKSR